MATAYTFKSLELQAPEFESMDTTLSPTHSLRIGTLADLAGTTAPTVRYYESVGLLPRADRQDGGQRRYGPSDVQRLQFIRRCRDFGFSIEQVRELVSLVEDDRRCCTDAREIARAHLVDVQARLTELRALEAEIASFISRCDESCAGGPGPACVPLTELTRPAAARTPANRAAKGS